MSTQDKVAHALQPAHLLKYEWVRRMLHTQTSARTTKLRAGSALARGWDAKKKATRGGMKVLRKRHEHHM